MAEHERDNDSEFLEGLKRREYFRVRTRLAIRTHLLRPEEADRLRLDVADRKPSGAPQLEPRLEQWLERIERKLDELRAQLDPQFERPLGAADMREVEISGSGLAWRGEPRYDPESWIRADFELPPPLARSIVVLARSVARSAGSDEGAVQAIAYDAIFEGDRDAIVRHCLDVERRKIQIEGGKPS